MRTCLYISFDHCVAIIGFYVPIDHPTQKCNGDGNKFCLFFCAKYKKKKSILVQTFLMVLCLFRLFRFWSRLCAFTVVFVFIFYIETALMTTILYTKTKERKKWIFNMDESIGYSFSKLNNLVSGKQRIWMDCKVVYFVVLMFLFLFYLMKL